MIENLFTLLDYIDNFFWSYVGVPAIIILGTYFSYRSKFFQIRKMPAIFSLFFTYFQKNKSTKRGIKPLHAFFASLGGCVGIGNVVGVCSAVQIGGPGAVFWMWITGLVGMMVKYGEIYLGITYRRRNKKASYDGGPMMYLQKVANGKWLAYIFCILMCIYGVEIYMFQIITHSITSTWKVNQHVVTFFLLATILLAGSGGVRLVGKISAFLIPLFLSIFGFMSMWILIAHAGVLPSILKTIFTSAFSGHAALGGFAGSTVMTTISQGVKRACYTGDLGIGYASIIHAESEEACPERQASLGIFGIVLDTFIICSLSVLLILVTNLWHQPIHEDHIVACALATSFPAIATIWPLFIFLLGYSTILAVFTVGRKAALFLAPRWGELLYTTYALIAFTGSTYLGTQSSLAIMSIAGMLLLVINLVGMFALKDQVNYQTPERQ